MLKTLIKQCDGLTLAILGGLFGITLLAISLIQYVFVERLLLNDAHTLTEKAVQHFSQNILSADKYTLANDNLAADKKIKPALTRSLQEAGIIADFPAQKTTRGLRSPKAEKFDATKLPIFQPKSIRQAPDLEMILNENLKEQDYLNELRAYAIYLPSGQVYLSDKLYNRQIEHSIYLYSYPVISSVQNVFIHGQPVYALHEQPNSSYSRHFLPVRQGRDVAAVVMLETTQSAAGIKIAHAVSNAVWLTALAGLPVIVLLMYLVWSRLSENLKAEQKINYLSQHDELTGLPNRSLFYRTLDEALERNKDGRNNFAVLLIDIDDFHKVNDLIGHSGADQILLSYVKNLLKYKPQMATVARLSADEFAMILPGISLAEEASYYADLLIDRLTITYNADGDELAISSSIGIAFGNRETNSAETLMKNAKLALYLAKQEEGTFRFFEPALDLALQKRRKLEMNLAQAIHNDQFEIYYQPQVALTSRKIIGYEALLRWHHPHHGIISPAEFIPVLEETKMIVEVGEYVLKRACEEALNWPGGQKLAVNMSPVQFEQQNVPEMVKRVLEETGFPAKRLEIEITESILMTNTDRAAQFLFALKRLGVDIALDDFGTGYSSLSYISKFEFDKIKIDRSFVSAIQEDIRARAIISSVISLGRALEVMVTAEGIETQEQLLLLQSAGCHFGQGFLFGKPQPLSEIKTGDGSKRQVA